MDKLLPVHKIIAFLSVLGLAVTFLLQHYVGEPAALEQETLKQEVSDLRGKLRELKCPPSQEQLRQLDQRIQNKSRGLQDVDQRVMARYAVVYETAISRNNWSLEAFMRQSPEPRRDFYMKEFDRIIRHSPFGDLDMEEGRLGLSRESDSPQRNVLLLQLWCLESLLKQASDCKLILVKLPRHEQNGSPHNLRRRFLKPNSTEEGKAEYALQAMPPHRLVANEADKAGGLLEFRFRLGVRGSLDQVEAFLQSLGQPKTFFGVGAFEVKQLPPGKSGATGRLQLNVECVTYVKAMPPARHP